MPAGFCNGLRCKLGLVEVENHTSVNIMMEKNSNHLLVNVHLHHYTQDKVGECKCEEDTNHRALSPRWLHPSDMIIVHLTSASFDKFNCHSSRALLTACRPHGLMVP